MFWCFACRGVFAGFLHMKPQEFFRAANGQVKTKPETIQTLGSILFMKYVSSISLYSLGNVRTLRMHVFQKAYIYL